MYFPSTDMDLLVHEVRENESKRLIMEAITAYRSGALRSAVISTWIASVFDIFSKLRELASLGEAAATGFVKDLDDAIEQKNIGKMQKIESTILDESQKIVGIFSQQDIKDLKRLQEDRNHCAHPSLLDGGSLYDITPEQVRSHIVYVLKHLLTQAPLQGKSVINRFETDILGKSFPLEYSEIELYIKHRYIDRVKDSSIISLAKGIFSAPFGSEHTKFSSKIQPLASSLKAIAHLKPLLFESELPKFIENYFQGVSEDTTLFICPFIKSDKRIWDWVGEPTRIKIRVRIQNSTSIELASACAYDALNIPELVEPLISIFPTSDISAATRVVSTSPSPHLTSVVLQTYDNAMSYRAAEELGQTIIIPLAKYFSCDDIQQLLRIARYNRQINQANGTAEVFKYVFDESVHILPQTKDSWESFISQMEELGNMNFSNIKESLATACG